MTFAVNVETMTNIWRCSIWKLAVCLSFIPLCFIVLPNYLRSIATETESQVSINIYHNKDSTLKIYQFNSSRVVHHWKLACVIFFHTLCYSLTVYKQSPQGLNHGSLSVSIMRTFHMSDKSCKMTMQGNGICHKCHKFVCVSYSG